jgi:hypothetical protein
MGKETDYSSLTPLPLRGTVPIDATSEDVNQSPRDAAKSCHVGPAESISVARPEAVGLERTKKNEPVLAPRDRRCVTTPY